MLQGHCEHGVDIHVVSYPQMQGFLWFMAVVFVWGVSHAATRVFVVLGGLHPLRCCSHCEPDMRLPFHYLSLGSGRLALCLLSRLPLS